MFTVDKKALEEYRTVKKGTNTNSTITVHNNNASEFIENDGIKISRRSYEDINKIIKVSLKIKYKEGAESILKPISTSSEYSGNSMLFSGTRSFDVDLSKFTEKEVNDLFEKMKFSKEETESLLEYIFPEKLDMKDKKAQEQSTIQATKQNKKSSSPGPTPPPRPSFDIPLVLGLHLSTLSNQSTHTDLPDSKSNLNVVVLDSADSNLNLSVFNLNSPKTSLGYSTPPIGSNSPELTQRSARSLSVPSQVVTIPGPPVPQRKSTTDLQPIVPAQAVSPQRNSAIQTNNPPTATASIHSKASNIVNTLSRKFEQEIDSKNLAEQCNQDSNVKPVLLSNSATNLKSPSSVQTLISNIDNRTNATTSSASNINHIASQNVANQKSGKLSDTKVLKELDKKLALALKKGPSSSA